MKGHGRPERIIICVDCGAAIKTTCGSRKRCDVCAKIAQGITAREFQRENRNKWFHNKKTCAACGVVVSPWATRCGSCQERHKKDTVNAHHRRYRQEAKKGCKGIDCFNCPYPDCIQPAFKDDLPEDWYE